MARPSILITLMAVAISVPVLTLLVLGWHVIRSEEQALRKRANPYSLAAAQAEAVSIDPVPSCLKLDERTKQILIKAIDSGLQEYIENLFAILLKEPVSQGSGRALRGADRAITAHQHALASLEAGCT